MAATLPTDVKFRDPFFQSGYAETIVVETRPGAAGRIAVEAVKSADADGSVMLFAPLGFMMSFRTSTRH